MQVAFGPGHVGTVGLGHPNHPVRRRRAAGLAVGVAVTGGFDLVGEGVVGGVGDCVVVFDVTLVGVRGFAVSADWVFSVGLLVGVRRDLGGLPRCR